MTKISTVSELKKNTVSEFVKSGISSTEAVLETEILLNFVFGITKKDLILNPDKILPAEKIKIFTKLAERRITEKIPVQYLTNKAFFMGEEFYVDENVLIPRPETEILVEEVLRHCEAAKLLCNYPIYPGFDDKCHCEEQSDAAISLKIIDVGTGSGCIACMIAKNTKSSNISAIDISQEALKVAELNAEKLGVKDKITFILSDIFENIDINEKFDVIVSNPPYISIQEKKSLQPEVVLHEPHRALFTEDEHGLDFYKKLIPQAKERLNKNGYLAVEIGIFQSKDVAKLFEQAGFQEIKIIKDYNKIDRFIIAGNF